MKRLNLMYVGPLSKFAFNFNFRRYTMDAHAGLAASPSGRLVARAFGFRPLKFQSDGSKALACRMLKGMVVVKEWLTLGKPARGAAAAAALPPCSGIHAGAAAAAAAAAAEAAALSAALRKGVNAHTCAERIK